MCTVMLLQQIAEAEKAEKLLLFNKRDNIRETFRQERQERWLEIRSLVSKIYCLESCYWTQTLKVYVSTSTLTLMTELRRNQSVLFHIFCLLMGGGDIV